MEANRKAQAGRKRQSANGRPQRANKAGNSETAETGTAITLAAGQKVAENDRTKQAGEAKGDGTERA